MVFVCVWFAFGCFWLRLASFWFCLGSVYVVFVCVYWLCFGSFCVALMRLACVVRSLWCFFGVFLYAFGLLLVVFVAFG